MIQSNTNRTFIRLAVAIIGMILWLSVGSSLAAEKDKMELDKAHGRMSTIGGERDVSEKVVNNRFMALIFWKTTFNNADIGTVLGTYQNAVAGGAQPGKDKLVKDFS